MEETHQPDERNRNSRGERENPRTYTRMGIPGNKKGGESTKQRTCINAHANMEIHIIMAHTKASIEGIPPKNIKTDTIWKQIMSRLITRINAIQHKTERAKIKREAKQEGFSHYNTNKKIEPLAQISETLDWHPKIEEELIRLNLVKPTNQENK